MTPSELNAWAQVATLLVAFGQTTVETVTAMFRNTGLPEDELNRRLDEIKAGAAAHKSISQQIADGN